MVSWHTIKKTFIFIVQGSYSGRELKCFSAQFHQVLFGVRQVIGERLSSLFIDVEGLVLRFKSFNQDYSLRGIRRARRQNARVFRQFASFVPLAKIRLAPDQAQRNRPIVTPSTISPNRDQRSIVLHLTGYRG